jgi:hypothetical protein
MKRGGKRLNKKIDDFAKEWSGVVLLAEANSNSGEKDFIPTTKSSF